MLANAGNQINAEGANLVGNNGQILGVPGKAISHAAVSALAAEIGGGNAKGAAAGALAASLAAIVLQETFSDSAKIQAGGKIIGGIAGAFATNNAKGANSGANSGEITIVYNQLAHALSMMEKEVPGTIKAHEESRKRLCAQSPNVCKMAANTLSFGADFLPVFGVIKSFKEAETAIDYLAATAGLLPGAGPAAGKMIKSANTALKHGDLETANKLIQQTRNELAVLQKNGVTSSTSKNAQEMAEELANQLNKNTVTFSTPATMGHIDLRGRAHFDKITQTDIPTPHVQTSPINIAPNGKRFPLKKQEVARPATKQDIRTARELAKKQGILK